MSVQIILDRDIYLDSTVTPSTLIDPIYAGDADAQRIRFRTFQKHNQIVPIDMSGQTITAHFIRPDGGDVVITGTGGTEYSYVDLPEACYVYPGIFKLLIRASTSEPDVVTSLLYITGRIDKPTTDTIIDPGTTIPSLEDLLAQIDACEDATAAANTAAANANAAALAGVRTDTDAQGLTDVQKSNARTNIGAADAEEVSQLSEDIVNIKDETLDGVFSSVTNRNLLDIYTDQSVVAGQNFNINLKNGLFYVNGTTGLIHRIKASNGIEHVTGNVPSGWTGESMGLTVGKVYYMSFIVVSGTVPTGIAVSCRNASNTSIISKSTSPVVLAEDAAYAQFYLPAGTYTNVVIAPYLIEGATGVSSYEELTNYVMRPNVIIPNYSDFYYAVPAKLSSETIHEYSSAPSASYHVQAMATDGTYLYYSLVVDDTSNTILVKYDIANDNVVLTKADHCYGHANGMAYIPDMDKIIVCDMDQTGTISYVDPDTLEFIESASLNDVLSPVVPFWYGVGAVAYCASNKKIVFLLRGIAGTDGVTRKGFAIFDSAMRFEKVCFTEYVDCESYSGLWADDDFIYLSITNPNSGSGEWLLFYDWHGTLVYQMRVSGLSHLEAQAIIDGVYYFCGNNFGGINCTIVKSEVLATTPISKIASLLKYNLNY